MAPPILDSLLLDQQNYAFQTNTTFRGLTISQTGEGWNIILRAFLRDGEAVYTMTTAEDPGEGLSRLLAVLGTNGSEALWHRDKYYQGNG